MLLLLVKLDVHCDRIERGREGGREGCCGQWYCLPIVSHYNVTPANTDKLLYT